MKFTELLLAELDREAGRTRRALEYVPQGRDDWKPHEKSMPLGRLAGLVASMPSWISLIIDQNELDLSPPGGQGQYQQPSTDKLVEALDTHVKTGRASLQKTTDDVLFTTNWRLLVSGKVVSEMPRHIVLRDTLNHLAHHRGQLTVYLRLCDQTVPAIYGPSADDQRFL
ncbi:MAG TPA: DinB family protein [Vicinamibacterales bacterium]|nr:DinB family protein [Vicinamibacterales bacterium]